LQQVEIDFEYEYIVKVNYDDVSNSILAFIVIEKESTYNYIMVSKDSTIVFDETMKVTQRTDSLGVVAVAD